MKLLINTAGNIGGGSMQVAISFINECRFFNSNEYHVILGETISPYVDTTNFSSNFIFYHLKSLKFYQQHNVLSKIEKKINPDVVFTVFGPSYWRPQAPHLIGFATSHHLHPESQYWNTISMFDIIKWKIKIAIHKHYIIWESDAIVVETEDTELRCRKFFGSNKQYFTVSNTCNSVFYEIGNQNIQPKLPIRKNNELRLLTLSKYYRHKNFELYPKIIDLLHEKGYNNIKFITTIAPSDYNRIFSDKYINTVINIGYVPIQECPALYNECDAMFLPTMLESFSASYPEAMLMGKPILTSHYGFAKSVCKNAAIYFDPTNIEDIVLKIIIFVENETLRTNVIKEGYNVVSKIPNAQDRTSSYLQICKSLIKK